MKKNYKIIEEKNFKGAIPSTSSNAITYAGILKEILKKENAGRNNAGTEPLANLDYSKELEIKNKALKDYWKVKNLPGQPLALKPSPKGRFYRTTTKRKVIHKDGKYYFLFGDNDEIPQNYFVNQSLLEPEEHYHIYDFVSQKINTGAYKLLGEKLNYIIIRGNYSEFTVIFNVHTLNAAIVNKLKLMAETLNKAELKIISVFIYLDPTRSEYYLENERPRDVINFKKLFGPDKIFLKFNNKKYSYHPTSFSQVNESMIPIFLNEAKSLLKSADTARLIDLYCGYGLFSLFLAEDFSEVLGIESEGESVNSAIHNSAYAKERKRIKFLPKRITGNNLAQLLPEQTGVDEFYLLDPPRQGLDNGVIKTIASRHPARVLHIFCGIERIKEELQEWEKNHYKVKTITPLDMFPGTPNLEILILLEANK